MQIQNTEKSRVHARSPLPAMKGTSSMLMTIVPILLSTVLGVAGQFLLKQGMTQMGTLQLSFAAVPSILWRMSTSPLCHRRAHGVRQRHLFLADRA
jgi:hypothetical protein